MGGGDSGPTDAQKRAEARREEEIAELGRQEDKRKAAAMRKRRGRASLISGSEQGIQETLG